MASRPKQEAMRERLSTLDPGAWYAPANRSEQTTLAFMCKRRVCDALSPKDGGRLYRLRRPEIQLGTFGAEVVPIAEVDRG